MILEAAIDNINDAKNSVTKGANRLEVCSDLFNDGLTPSLELFLECKKLNVPCFVMIRPKKGNFTVTNSVFNQMKDEIKQFKKLKADGFVLGILKEDNSIDIERINELVDLAEEIPITFHKAIDVSSNILQATKDLLNTKIKRILTSGGKKTVLEGISTIKEMYNIVGENITLVAGGGVTFANINDIATKLPFCEFHGRKIVNI